jgi:beta-phosphoglucomutase-like phosphatase (HAD superfamily)
MTSQPMDFTDYLIRQQQQAWQQSQIDKLFPNEEDRNAQIARRIEDQAHNSAEGAAVDASEAEEGLIEVITEARDLRKKITSGVVSPDDARHALAELRQRHKKIAAHVPSIKTAYEGAVKTIDDPAARVTELTSKFPSLRR